MAQKDYGYTFIKVRLLPEQKQELARRAKELSVSAGIVARMILVRALAESSGAKARDNAPDKSK